MLEANNVAAIGFDYTNPNSEVGISVRCDPASGQTSGQCPKGNNTLVALNYLHDISQNVFDGTSGLTGCPAFGMIDTNGAVPHGQNMYQVGVQIVGNRLWNYGAASQAPNNGGTCNESQGIYFGQNDLVAMNIVGRINTWGIQFYSQPCNGAIIGNTLDQNGKGDIVLGGADCGQGPITVNDNIMESGIGIQLGAGGVAPCTSTTRIIVADNLFKTGITQLSGSLNGCTDVSGSLSEAPTATFASYSASSSTNDYHLNPSSVAVGSGVSGNCNTTFSCTPPFDAAGNASTTPPSRGAYSSGSGGGGTAIASLSPNPATFPSTPLGSCSTPQSITLSNLGTASLTQNANSSITPNQMDFRFDFNPPGTCNNGTLAGGQTCTTNVKFCPSSMGARTANFNAFTTAGNPSSVMNGTATAPVAPSNLTITVQ